MKRSISSNSVSSAQQPPRIRKSSSVNAISEIANYVEAVELTNAPILQATQCMVAEFPQEIDDGTVSCLMTPCEPIRPSTVNPLYLLEQRYIDLAAEDKDFDKRYQTWLERLKKKKNE
jgi:hypothetical protein